MLKVQIYIKNRNKYGVRGVSFPNWGVFTPPRVGGGVKISQIVSLPCYEKQRINTIFKTINNKFTRLLEKLLDCDQHHIE